MFNPDPDTGSRFIDFIPYLSLIMGSTNKVRATDSLEDGRGRPLITRLIESSLPGIFVALVYMYTTGQTNTTQIVELKAQVTKLQDQQIELIRLVSELKTTSDFKHKP